MSSLPVNQNFALSDVSIAIAQDGPNTHSMIYIYPIITEDCEKTKKKTQRDAEKKDTYNFKTDDPTLIKKLRYSGEPMDVVYSSRFLSISKDGRYLAISWLPNPRLGNNVAMKYCTVYDLDNLDPQSNGNTDDNLIKLGIPCGIFEFCGGCIFTNDGKFVLINDTKALVYSIQEDSGFDLDFTLRISPKIGSVLDKIDGKPIFDFFPSSFQVSDNVLEKEIISKLKSSIIQNSATVAGGDDNYDDIFFDDSGDEFISDLDEEEKDENEDLIEIDTLADDTMAGESAPQYQAYLLNDRFIRNNIKNIKDIGVVCLVSSSTESISNNNVSETYSLFAWSLVEKRLVFVKKLEHGEYRPNLQYVAAFTEQRNLVALCKRYDSFDNSTTHQLLGTKDSPVSTLYDCNSGVVVANFCLPKEREISSISQILFLQNDTYFLTISHDRNNIFFDIWDVLSATHLDTFIAECDENQLCMDYSRFILNDKLQLTSGCGVYLQVEYQRTKDPLTTAAMISTTDFKLSIQKVTFFNDKNAKQFVRGCRCGKTTFYSVQGALVCPKDVRNSKAYTLKSLEDLPDCNYKDEVLFFLDTDHKYMMSCQWDPSTTGVDILMMSVLEVSRIDRKEIGCDSPVENHDLKINFKTLKYKFILNRNDYLRSESSLIGHPTLFLDIKAIRGHCIKQLSPIILYTDVPNKSPILLLEINHFSSRKDFSRGFFLKENEEPYIEEQQEFPKEYSTVDPYVVAIPLHSYSGLESHLHALATQNMISCFDKYGVRMKDFHYNDYVNISYANYSSVNSLTDPERLPTKLNLIEWIRSSGEYFSTLAGYATICRLAVHRDHYEVLSEILKETTKVNYCVLATDNRHRLIDPLQEALKNGAVKNARLIVKHIKHSVATYGAEYGRLLIKHRQLLVDNNISVDF